MQIKKIVTWILSAAMISSMLPAPVFAADSNAAKTMEMVTETVTAQVSPELDLPSNDELFALYAEQVLYGYEMATFGTMAWNKLNPIQQNIYDALKLQIKTVSASGGSTVFEIPASEIPNLQTSWTFTDDVTENEAVAHAQEQLDAQITEEMWSGVVNALLSDCPFDLYWFDKLKKTSFSTKDGATISWNSSTKTVSLNNLTFISTFKVVTTYQDGNDTTVIADVEGIKKIKEKAQGVVDDNINNSPYEKLVAYKEYICEAVSYNHDAAADGYTDTYGYGDPWQLIYVFDEDSSTKVVCEGYAKAFQYLCDLDDALDEETTNDFNCISPTGDMISYDEQNNEKRGPHMWNAVNLKDNYYLVDVTNCDTGMVGQNDKLFLRAITLNKTSYSDLSNLTYEYDAESLDLMGFSTEEPEDDLKLATEDYVHVVTYPVIVNGSENGTVTVSPANAAAGTEVTLTVTPDEGYELDKLTVMQGETSVEVADNKFTMPEGGVTVTATFKNHEHNLTYTAEGTTITATCSCGNPGSITLTAVDKTYDGQAFVATVDKTGTLAGVDVTVTYDANDTSSTVIDNKAVNAGNYTASITVGGETVTADFTIGKAPLTITAEAQTKVYGDADPELTYMVTGLVEGDTLTGELIRAKGENVGEYAIEQGALAANDNYEVTYKGANLAIKEKEIEIDTVTIADVMYNGEGNYELIAEVKFKGLAENEAVDYTTEFTLPEDFGTAAGDFKVSVKVTLNNNNYTLGENPDTVEADVIVVNHTHKWSYALGAAANTIIATCGNTDEGCPIDGETKTVTLTLIAPEGDALNYDGNPKTVIVEQSVHGAVTGLPEVTYTGDKETDGKAINAGDYTATLKMSEGVEATVNFAITAKNITNATVVFGEMTYTGQSQTPTAIVTIDGLTVSGTWTEVTGVGQESTFTSTDGNFTGTLTKDPGMKKATPIVTAPVAVENLTYETNTSYDLVTAGSSTGGELQYSLDENGTYGAKIPVGTNAGTYTVWYKVVGDNNYADVAAQSVYVTIASKAVTATFEGLAAYYLHTGSAVEPTFTLKDGDTVIPADEYTVTYSNNVDAGTNATITITDKEGGNYAVSGSTTFEIKKHTHKWEYTANEDTNTITAKCEGTVGECPLKNTAQKVTLVAPTALTYDGKVKEATVSGTIDGVKIPTITYAGDNFTADKAINAGNYTATIAMGEGDNKAVVSVEFTIVPKAITGAEIGAFGALTYDGSAQTPVATVTIDGLEATGSWSQVINVADKTTFTADGNFTGTIENMETGMAKAEQDAPIGLDVKNETLKGQKDGSISSMTVAMNSMEYATTKDGEYKTIENDQMENLAAGTYYVRYKETDNYKPGAATEVTIAEGKPITVIFNANGKTFASEFSAQLENQSYGTKFTKPTDPKETSGDFVFGGWYKDAGCTTAWNFETDTLTPTGENVTLYAQWKQVRFNIQVDVKRDNTAYTGEVTVTLMRGSETTATVTGTAPFTFEHVDTGVYNLVAAYADGTKTELVTIDKDDTITINLPAPGVKSQLTVKDDSNTPDIMVGGLDKVAAKMKENNPDAAEVTVTMDIEGKKESQVSNEVVEKIEEAITGSADISLNTVVEYLNINIMGKIGDADAKPIIDTEENVLEIVVPFNFAGRNGIKVIHYHGNSAVVLDPLDNKPAADSEEDGKYWMDTTNGYIYIYSKQFSPYAISYTTAYTITFDVNGGEGSNSTMTTNGNGTVTLPTNPTRSGYTFNGWYTAPTGGEQITASTVFSGDTTVYAQWTQNYYGGGNYDGGDYSAPTYAVSVPTRVENGTVSVSSKNTSKGSTVTLTVTPDEGYELDTLIVTDKNGKEITLIDKGNGKFSFTMPASKIDIKATFVEIPDEPEVPVNPFYDVAEGDYFFNAVQWANENGITSGVGNGQFAPHATCTRAQMVTFLWNAAGCPNVSADYGIFNDVAANDYYYKAVLWANANKITSGTGNGAFSPDQICTRAQMATFLYKFAEGKAEGSSNPFADVTASDYYAKPVQWAVENGITSGTGANTFGPADPCTRAQMVTFLYRLLAE